MYRYKKLLISVHIKQGCEREFLQGQKKISEVIGTCTNPVPVGTHMQ